MSFKRRRHPETYRGEDHPRAVLTEKVVRMLRRKKKEDGTINCSHWARKLGVSPQTVSFAVNPRKPGGTWRHVK
jgi:hypothetical protein